jgi:hypothetical protein
MLAVCKVSDEPKFLLATLAPIVIGLRNVDGDWRDGLND